MKRKFILMTVAIVAALLAIYFFVLPHRRPLLLTGVVTTDEVIVSAEIQGRIQQLLVREGDTVTNGQLLAVLRPQEHRADVDFYTNTAQESSAQVLQAEADLQYQVAQSSNLIRQSEANLAATQDQVTQAEADLENFSLTYKREQDLYKQGVDSIKDFDQARTAYDSAVARAQSLRKQVIAAQAAVALAQSTRDQIASRRAGVAASRDQQAAAAAQADKARVQLGYTEIRAPVSGIIDTRAALAGEVVNPGQAIVTIIDQDHLWVRADVEETYIDRIRLGEKFPVRLPSGVEMEGTVFFRGVDADYATQRDVSRTKRDIKTFEIRLRCENQDRALAVGMTATVALSLGQP